MGPTKPRACDDKPGQIARRSRANGGTGLASSRCVSGTPSSARRVPVPEVSAPAPCPRPRRRVMHVVLNLEPGGTERLVIEIAKTLTSLVDSLVCCLDQP